MTIETLDQTYRFTCDVCGATKNSMSTELPPDGFTSVSLHVGAGRGYVFHLCTGPCLSMGADNLVEGRHPNGLTRFT